MISYEIMNEETVFTWIKEHLDTFKSYIDDELDILSDHSWNSPNVNRSVFIGSRGLYVAILHAFISHGNHDAVTWFSHLGWYPEEEFEKTLLALFDDYNKIQKDDYNKIQKEN